MEARRVDITPAEERLEYPRTLKAAQDLRRDRWALAIAIVAEARRSPTGRQVKQGEAQRISSYLADHGERVAPHRIAQLYQVAYWTAGREELRQFPIERVIHARFAAKRDHDVALTMLRRNADERITRTLHSRKRRHRLIMARGDPSPLLARAEDDLRAALWMLLLNDEGLSRQDRRRLRARVRTLQEVVGYWQMFLRGDTSFRDQL